MKKIGKNAPHGQFLNHAETIALAKGREFIQTALQTLAQEEIDEYEKKNEERPCPKCQTKMRHLGDRTKAINTSAGKIKVERLYCECRPCNLPFYMVDEPFGLVNDYTAGFRSIVVRAGADRSFEQAADDLHFYCGLKVGRMTIRKLCYEEAPKMEKWVQETPTIATNFTKASGNVEVAIDATKVNTMDGWRDAKIALMSKRPLGKGVSVEEWDDKKRLLPDFTIRVAFAAIEEKDLFWQRLKVWRQRLRLGLTGDISVLADGADWIWNISRLEFGKVRECLDFYHALEHLRKLGKLLYDNDLSVYKQWYKAAKQDLVSGGFALIDKRLAGLEDEMRTDEERTDKKRTKKRRTDEERTDKDRTDEVREALRLLRNYFANHSDRMHYRERLSEGRAIGSGQVEGACKSMVGKRLKQTGARWHVSNLNRMLAVCSLRYGSAWDDYWKKTT